MANTIFYMLTAMLVGMIFTVISYALGMALIPARSTEDKNQKMADAMIAPVLGFSAYLVVVNFLYQLSIPYVLVTIIVLLLSILIIVPKRKKIAPPKEFPWFYIAISFVLSFVTIYAVFPKMIDGGLYFPPSSYDHARIALVDSVEKNGLPLLAPWITNGGEFVPVGYHYGIHVLMGYIADLTKIDNFIVASAVQYVIAEVTILLIGALAVIVSKKRDSLYFMLLLLISSSALVGIFENVVPAGDRFGFWPFWYNLIWCPHHCIAASMVIVMILLVEELLNSSTRKDSLMISVLIGLATAASAYCSIYSGAIAVLFYIVAFFVYMIFDSKLKDDFKRKFWYFMLSVAVGVLLALPYLIDLIKNALHVPTFEFGYVPFIPTEEGMLAPIIMFLKMYLLYLPIRIGVQYIFGFIGIIGFIIIFVNRKRKRIAEPGDEFLMRLVTFAIISFVIVFFIHSSIYSNDFGWRTIIPAKYIGIAFGSSLLMRVYSKLRDRKLLKVALGLVLVILSFWDIDREVGQILIQRDDYPELHMELANIRDGWVELQEHTDENDIVLCSVDDYPEIFPDWGSGTPNYMFSFYANRYSLMGDYPYAVTSGASLGQDKIDELHSRISLFFEGDPKEEEVDYFADTEKVKAIFVVKQDGLFDNEGSIRSRYPHMVEGECYKIYY